MNADVIQDVSQAEEGTSLWQDAWVRLCKNHLAVIGLGILLIMILVALLTPWIAPYAYDAQNLDLVWQQPPTTRIGRFARFPGHARQVNGNGSERSLGQICSLFGPVDDAFLQNPTSHRPSIRRCHRRLRCCARTRRGTRALPREPLRG